MLDSPVKTATVENKILKVRGDNGIMSFGNLRSKTLSILDDILGG